MNRLNLNICGGEHTKVGFDEVCAVETPQATETWRPISHSYLIDRVRTHLDDNGYEIVAENHNLARFGQRYFGLFQVNNKDREQGDRGTILGLRNAHDKCFPAGLCAGDAPFVCDNLIFHNEIVLARRHTKNIMTDLPQVIARTIGKLSGMWNTQDKRIESYKDYDVTNAQANDLVIRAYQAGAISKAKIADVVEQWETPEHPEFKDRNMNSLYNGFTAVLRGGVMQLPKRSDALHSVLDSEVGLTLATKS